MEATLARNWWTLVIRGVAAIIFGVLAYLWPSATFAALVLLFGAYALVDGALAFVGAFRTQGDRRWSLILEGVVGIAAGVVTFLWPGAAGLGLLIVIAAWALITGIFEIVSAIRLRKEIEGEWLLLLSGLLSVLFAVTLVLWPAAGALAVTWIIGAYAIAFGIVLIALGIKLRNEKRDRLAPA